MNETKTEEYEVKQNGNESWKECRLLGSLINTDKDISRRASLAIVSIKNLKHIFCNRKLAIKTCVFNCYVARIFLYNSE